MHLLHDTYLKAFTQHTKNLAQQLEHFKETAKSLNFDYLIASSSVYSSKIEGNSLDLNSFMNAKLNEDITLEKSKDVAEIEDLMNAYLFAEKKSLNEKNVLYAHNLATLHLLDENLQGKYRTERVGVFGREGLTYMAIEPEFVEEKMQELFADMTELLERKLTATEIFYYASQLHLIFVQIHPFADGNGRSARLLEKRFITEKLGKEFWKLESERRYREHRPEYYTNLHMGVNWYLIDYSKSLPFLLILTKSVE
ncbi:MAG: Fic family protein [Candidatus Peribacteria bacterium]|jgi:Fic family protein|nr:Fic family protein [Candidatus Peribacteria bacterium]